ncbi:hypothetical protein FT663_01054 [Candidozyma haemuli var. vulneris]|uniref:Uncharacterized protein n=1 Tax=Candidozyma haemuli TaxID=45357 RepID=A0A2V1AU00_9ASCO|nr:hypothetical protein CXQ85_000257 [[Candida] haemuloni]KAF3990276.1 hypothetical protein FT662_02370 [[Candida] haemuloni var. vulneris]KAF3994824.1 hypothetical protein FT663_01054 [[Candida] haemuloni var. vulneris]PVH21285.1 hypothetical protein CXQ85_000257 [[Candida] haemuloni]
MKLVAPLLFAAAVLADIAPARDQFYPLDRKGEIPQIQPYTYGQDVFIDCITRNIDNGEHKFDSNDRIIYGAFPVCKETGQPLSFHYGVSEDFNCTITFTDELYHLFQLYIHEDVPFGCRIPLSTEANSLEKGGASIPLTFNFRGEIHDAHLDIDNHMNLLIVKPPTNAPEKQTVISAVAWSSGTNATRVVIGDELTLQMGVRWIDNIKPSGGQAKGSAALPFDDGFYRFPISTVPISMKILIFLLSVVALVSFSISYAGTSMKYKKRGYRSLDTEAGIAKQD